MIPDALLRSLSRSLILGLTGLACDAKPSAEGAAAGPASRAEARLVVFAAASLRDVFAALGEDFERAHPSVRVTFNFAGTQELITQVEHGASPDVVASADLQHMDELVRAGRVTAPRVFARNRLVLVVARESAGRIRSLADLPAAARIVVGGPDVPIGRYTTQALERASKSLGADFRARVEARIVSRELNVRQVLAKVRLGEADAGFVYRTDAIGARGEVAVVELPPDVDVRADYPVAVAAAARHPTLAAAWIALVVGPGGQRALAEAGFDVEPGTGGAP